MRSCASKKPLWTLGNAQVPQSTLGLDDRGHRATAAIVHWAWWWVRRRPSARSPACLIFRWRPCQRLGRRVRVHGVCTRKYLRRADQAQLNRMLSTIRMIYRAERKVRLPVNNVQGCLGISGFRESAIPEDNLKNLSLICNLYGNVHLHVYV